MLAAARRCRAEAEPLIADKLKRHLDGQYDSARVAELLGLLTDHARLASMSVPAFMDVRVH